MGLCEGSAQGAGGQAVTESLILFAIGVVALLALVGSIELGGWLSRRRKKP